MKSSEKAKIAIIGGTGFEKFLAEAKRIRIGTPYGIPPPLFIGELGNKIVFFLPRHGVEHSVPPHKINYRANIYGLYTLGVERIIAINAVGAINPSFKPGDLVVPHDFVDFTKMRSTTFYDQAPVTHIDVSQPYCPEIRESLIKASEAVGVNMWGSAVLVCTEGPRFETPAEIEMFKRLGFDIVGMTGVPEAILARELGICYAALCFVSNRAAGMQERLTPAEVYKVSEQVEPKIKQILIETVDVLPLERKRCLCMRAPEDARVK